MAKNQKVIDQLNAAIAGAQRTVDACHAKQATASAARRGNPQGAGFDRDHVTSAPSCKKEEDQLRNLQDDLARAKRGEPVLPPGSGQASRDLAARIRERSETAGVLMDTIAVGTAITAGETIGISTVATGGRDLTDTAEALGAIPTIERAATKQDIELFLVTGHPNKVEREYWEDVLSKL